MKKITFKKVTAAATLCASLLCSITASAESFVWKVSKNNDVVYVGGTMHILPTSEFPLPTEFTNVYNMVDTIVLETELPDKSDTSFQAQMMQKMSYSNGKQLTDVLSKRTYKQLSEYMADFGASLDDLSGFKPGFIVTIMAIMEAKRSNISGDGVDVYFNELALKDNKGIEYLETITIQLDMLSNMGLGNEESFIKSNLAQMNGFKSMFSKLIKAWRIGDEVTLNDIVITPMLEYPATLKALLTDRNKNWLPKIERMFGDQDKEFVLVGAGHLVGENSVLALLKAKGYQIEKFQ